MSEQRVALLEVTTDEKTQIETLAYQRGYESVEAYLRALIETDAERIDDALWDAQFAASQDILDLLAEEARAEHSAGLTEEFDPDNDPDAP
jgi:hypothetical protein